MKLFDVYPIYPIDIRKGNGQYVYDELGNRYLDFYGGHAVISIGHSHPQYVQKIEHQVRNLGFYSNSVKIHQQDLLAEKLGQISGYDHYQLFLCNSGAESVENALKLASFKTSRKHVLAFSNGFHGRTSLAVAVTDNHKLQAPVNENPNVSIVSMDQPEKIREELNSKKYAAVIIEGIQGIGGIVDPGKELLRKLSRWTKDTGTVLILDEIQSGYGRTGDFFAHEQSGIRPDLITIAKGMGNGFPIGGVLISPEFQPEYGLLGTTFGGNHLACAAGIAVLEVMENEQLIANAKSMGNYLLERLSKINGIREVRGRGLMIGADLNIPVTEIRKELLFEDRIFTGNAKNPNTLRFLPPMCINRKDCDYFLESLNKRINDQ